MKLRRTTFFAALALAMSSMTYLACDDSSSAIKESSPDTRPGTNPGNDGGPGADGGDGGPTDCVQNPTTHEEIINACTNAVRIAKNPSLPRLLPDGALPPLE